MTDFYSDRFLFTQPAAHLQRPLARIQPILAKKGNPDIDLAEMANLIAGTGELCEPIIIESPEQWQCVISELGDDIDAILPVSITAYPTEIWNSHPQPLVDRQIPIVFWPIIKYDEPNFWRWSARDMLRALGVPVHLVKSNRQGLALLRALAMKRLLANSSLLLFGAQNFPWNATAAGHLITQRFGTKLKVLPLSDFRDRAASYTDAEVDAVWHARKTRYRVANVRLAELNIALRTYMAIKELLVEHKALGFGVNCFGELITEGGRDVPCLAQTLAREDGYIASCDGDFLAMMSMVLGTFMLEKCCMMANMYPIQYIGAITDHFGDPLQTDPQKYLAEELPQLARMAHCAFGGVISPEMTPTGCVALQDWGGTYEMHRDGRGCGIDGDLRPASEMTAIQLRFDGATLLLAKAEVCENTRHGLSHCESTVLFKFRNLPDFIENISREHTVFVYDDHIEDLQVFAELFKLDCMVF